MLKIMMAAGMALLLAGCATSFTSEFDKPNGKTLIISKSDWAGYQKYRSKVGSTNKGAFAVGVRGGMSDGYAWSLCPGTSCFAGPPYATEAMRSCREGGGECIIFAMNSDIVVNYRLEE